MHNRRVFLMKNNVIALLAFTQTDDGTLIGKNDPRQAQPIQRCFAPFGDERARSFDGQIADSEKKGWKVVAETDMNFG